MRWLEWSVKRIVEYLRKFGDIGASCLLSSTWVVFLSSALVCMKVSATQIIPVSLENLTHSSSAVVHGTVANVESFWNKNRTAIYTRLTFKLDRSLKGSPPGEVTVLLPGGTVGERSSIVVGAPQIGRGQEVVLFLERVEEHEIDLPASATPFRLTDLFQGVFTVETDAVTGQKRAVSHALSLLGGDAAQLQSSTILSVGGTEGLPLDELTTRVQRIH